jgi:glucose-6-phosphate 1-epimerase
MGNEEREQIHACHELRVVEANTIYRQAETGFKLLKINNSNCNALVSLHGAQILSFIPHRQPDLLWVSPNAHIRTGTAIRGGIPVCLPWFGVNRQDPHKPKHGFARTSRWTLERASTDAAGVTGLRLGLREFGQQPQPLFDYRFEAELDIRFGQTLEILLTVKNCADTPMPLSWALHSYHPVHNLATTTITGLEQTEYLDNTCQLARRKQLGNPEFRAEIDRVYLNVGREQVIVGEPPIRVAGINAPSAIVWNPGPDLSAAMEDLGNDMHLQFICLERGAAFDDEQMLLPGETLQASVTISTAADQA